MHGGPRTVLVTQGRTYRVEFLVRPDGSVPARAFLDGFTEKDGRWFRQKQTILGSIDAIAELPRDRRLSPERFKAVEGSEKIFEFKAFQLRVYCFFRPGSRLILEFGVVKKTDKHSSADVARAEEWRDAFIAGEEAEKRKKQ